ncbi:MAG: KH domain-containing protein [Clostridia bacterium]|nr:KH domain-containing protein [Clostridia bacterium]
MELEKVLTDVVCSIVDKPEEVRVTREEDGNEIVLVLTVAPDDMGKVIGKHGRIAKALRLIIKAAAVSSEKRVDVEIRD